MVHNNSLTAYRNQVLPNIKAKHSAVIKTLIILGEATSQDVADHLNKPLHTLSGRFTELSGNSDKEYGKAIIEQCGIRKNARNQPCAIWRIKFYPPTQPLEQANLFQ